jgi:ABC-type multidrug transport system fused ATPase/permease subunit
MKPFLRRQPPVKPPLPPGALTRQQVIGRLLHYVTRYRGVMALVVLLLLVGTILNLAVPYLLGVGINNLSGARDGAALQQTVLLMAGAAVVSWLLLVWQGQVLAAVVQRAMYDLRRQVFNAMMPLSLSFFDRRPIGELISSVTNDTEVVAQFFTSSLGDLISQLIRLVFIVIAMVWLDWRLAIAALVIAPLFSVFIRFLGQASGPAYQALQQEISELTGMMEETLSGEKVVIAYDRQEEAIAAFEEISWAATVAGQKARFISQLSRPATLVLTNLDIALVALVGGSLTLRGLTDVGTVATFLQYTRQLAVPLSTIAGAVDALFAAIASGERIFRVLDEQPAIVDRPDAQPMPPIQGHVEFQAVDFSYVPGRKILKHNTFEAKPGQKIGLCGPTGAGKSTLINLITRYYDVDSGDIRIDGRSLYDVRQADLRRQIGIVLQEPFLFSDTVLNNLRYARLEATEADCLEAAKRANAHDFIQRLPEGYDTLLTERGSNLSQGQRQLLTIARMMVQDPRLVILDEATSNVDTQTEKKIQEALNRLMEGRTSFVIAHRLSTIRDSDLILVLKAGEIIERGTHDEMMAQQGFYYNLFMSQFKGKLEGMAV